MYEFNPIIPQMLRAPFPLFAKCPVHVEKDCRACGGRGIMPFTMVITYRVQKAMNNLRSAGTIDPDFIVKVQRMPEMRAEWQARVTKRLAHLKETWSCPGHGIVPYHDAIGHLPDGGKVYRVAGLRCAICGYEPGKDDLPYKGWGQSFI